jgi:uncharacterized protein (TIGR03435 family)
VFEVASVKPNNSRAAFSTSEDGPGVYVATNMSLRGLLIYAFRLHPILDRDRLVGPAWIEAARFDITARKPADRPFADAAEMLRALLVDRFGLIERTELRDGPVLALVAARSDGTLGAQIAPSRLDCSAQSTLLNLDVIRNQVANGTIMPQWCGISSSVDANGGLLFGGGRSMSDLAKHLSALMARRVIDRTRLAGAYDFVVRFTPESSSNPESGAGPSKDGTPLVTALREQLGLKLDPQRGQVEYIVIDRIEQPSAN